MLNKISAADAGKNLSDIINRVAFDHEPVILTMSGEPTAAIVSLEYLQYFQYLEDQADIAEALKAAEQPGENITAEQMRKQLGLTR
jgi:prevent-host-death family protein